MLSRRAFLALGLVACSRTKDPPREEPSLAWPRTTVHEGVTFIELFPHEADETSPIVLAIHGRGDRAENWVSTWRSFPARARILLPQAPIPFGEGGSWFDLGESMTDEQLGAAVGAAEEKLWKGVAKIAAGRRLIVTGFSQGGILSFAMASRHPDAVARAFPVAGSCPGPLLPKEKSRAAPVVAFHGTDDDVLAIRWAREAVKAFSAAGNEATLREYPGVKHRMTGPMLKELWIEMVNAVASTPAGDR